MKDQISALMDDELIPHSAEHVFIAVKAGGEASECWATYHLIGDAMRGNPIYQSDFQQRLMQKLADEPTILAPRSKKAFSKKPVLWSAVASVAAVMFVGWMVLQQQVQGGSDIVPMEIAQNLPSEYLLAHQALSPSSSAYYIQPASYAESGR